MQQAGDPVRGRAGAAGFSPETSSYRSSLTFSKADRLLKRSDFLRLSRSGRKVMNRFFVVIFSPGQGCRTRLGVTVSKRVGPATTRNRVKRLVREYYRKNRPVIAGKWDLNVIARKPAADASSGDVNRALHHLFGKIRR